MAITDIKSGDAVFYCHNVRPHDDDGVTCEPVIVNEVFCTFVTVCGMGADRFRYPGGGLIGNGWGEWLSLYDWRQRHE